jgi:hypothetical protein
MPGAPLNCDVPGIGGRPMPGAPVVYIGEYGSNPGTPGCGKGEEPYGFNGSV